MSKVEQVLFGTKDPELMVLGQPGPALTTLLLDVCGDDGEKFATACRLVSLFVEQALKLTEPAGWRLVPVVASPSQRAAGQKAFDSAGINKIDSVYRAMVETAPEYNKDLIE